MVFLYEEGSNIVINVGPFCLEEYRLICIYGCGEVNGFGPPL